MRPLAASTFFRDARFPSTSQDRMAHERFLLDSYAERRASARPGRRPFTWVRSILGRKKTR